MLARISALAAMFIAFSVMTTPAFAAWHKAESDRFVIYSDSRPEDLRELGEMLERYHIAMELETGRRLPVPSPSNRLTVYMVGDGDDLRKVYGDRNSSVAGFYMPRANGSVTFVSNIRAGGQAQRRNPSIGTRVSRSGSRGAISLSMTILLHEYAHHFLISSSPFAMPRWLSEGSAEYFSSARFNDDGSVDIGLPNNNRAWELQRAAPVSVRELLSYELYRKKRGGRYDAYYGRSWLLYHYLRFNPGRNGQLVKYWEAVATGTESLAAGEAIFGDLDKLSKELSAYADQRSMAAMRMPAGAIRIGDVTTARLSKGHAAMMDVIIRSKRGVSRKAALELLPSAQSIAKRYPDDAAVLAALAEAEYDAGNDDAAIAAADRAIAIDPATKNALVQKGYALFRKAKDVDEGSRKVAYDAAMGPFEALNSLESDHTQPLIYYYRSFSERGVEVPEGAKFALERATQLAPFDKALAIEVAQMRALDGDTEVSGYLLRPVAADPHASRESRIAQAMIAYLERVPEGSRVDLRAVTRAFEEAEAKARKGNAQGEETG